MSLISLVVTLAVVGLLLWAINTIIPMDGKIKQVINVVVIVFICIWMLQQFGLLGSIGDVRIR
jgi:hypothetical protein